MRILKSLLFSLLILLPLVSYAGEPFVQSNLSFNHKYDESNELLGYYDLRNRSTYVQVTHQDDDENPLCIHVQIFQQDRGCTELNFEDELTPNDTVIYDLDNILRNDGTAVPINLLDDSSGYVVVTDENTAASSTLIGNFRIIDNSGYEYRTNMAGAGPTPDFTFALTNYIANFNTIDGAQYADIIGYAYDGSNLTTVRNLDLGVDFNIFVFDMDEEPLSCDTRNFACGAIMNYGINEDYTASRESNLLCPGGGLADPNGGYVSLENPVFTMDTSVTFNDDEIFVGLIGLNNGDGTGSMDYWIHTPFGPDS